MRKTIFFLLLLFSTPIIGQDSYEWVHAFAPAFDAPKACLPAPGGYVLFGSLRYTLSGLDDAYMARLDGTGKLLNLYIVGQPNVGEVFGKGAVAVGADWIAGGSVKNRGWLVRLDAKGNIVWSVENPWVSTYSDLVALPDGAFLACGNYLGTGIVTRFGADGKLEWTQTYGVETVKSLCLNATGGNAFLLSRNKILKIRVSDGRPSWTRSAPTPELGGSDTDRYTLWEDIVWVPGNKLAVIGTAYAEQLLEIWTGYSVSLWADNGDLLWDKVVNAPPQSSLDITEGRNLTYLPNAQNLLLAGHIQNRLTLTRINLNGQVIENFPIGSAKYECYDAAVFKHTSNYVVYGQVFQGNMNSYFYKSVINDPTPLITAGFPPAGEQTVCFPNPASERTTVQLRLDDSRTLQFSLIDMTGRIVYSKSVEAYPGENRFELELEKLPAGVYSLQTTGAPEAGNLLLVIER